MSDLTPRDDVKKKVSEILKRVDQLLKAGELDQAIPQLTLAKETDPKNVYILAYEERVAAMMKERQEMEIIEGKRRQEEEAKKREEEARRKIEEEKRRVQEEARRKAEEERRKKEEERLRAEEEEKRKKQEEQRRKEEEAEREEEERRKVEDLRRQQEKERLAQEEMRKKIDSRRKEWEQSTAKPGKVEEEEPEEERDDVPEIPRSLLEETKRKILEERRKKGAPDLNISQARTYRHPYHEGLAIYKKMLIEAWADGATTPAEEEQLKGLRSSLMIVLEDHTRLEKEAKIESYANAFRKAWSSGSITPESASALTELRKKFKITLEEHEQIEARLLWELRPGSSEKSRILIIDDDEKLLNLVANTLEDAGFQVVAFTTSDEAYSFLQSQTPDAIISDINLETSTMGGFTFYEKVREIDRLEEIPFIFLTGLTDEVLIRTGKEMGVDDYLTKPFSENNLIATIKGRLKRSSRIKKSRQKK